MLPRELIILACLVAVLGIGYLFRTVFRRKRKSGKPPTKEHTAPLERVEETAAPAAVENAVPVPEAPRPKIEIAETPIPGSDLRYYKPFGPNDTIFDVWLKFQAFTSSQPIAVRLIPADDTAPIVKSDFFPDGTLRSTKEMFLLELENSIRSNGGPTAWRAVRRLSSFGIPASAPESAYHIFTGSLRMELKGVQIMGLTFSVTVTFEPNLGWIPGHFSHLNEYFHSEMQAAGGSGRGRVEPENVVVGFPWTLTRVSLYSDDPSLAEESSKITKGMLGKYEKHVRQGPAVAPTADDPTRNVTIISDGIVVISLHEGLAKSRRFLRIDYGPSPQGPIDEIPAGDEEYVRFAKALAETDQPCLVPEEEATLNTPF